MSRSAVWAGVLGCAAIAVGVFVWAGARGELAAAAPEPAAPVPRVEAERVSLANPGALPESAVAESAHTAEPESEPAPRRVVEASESGPTVDDFLPGIGEGLLRVRLSSKETGAPLEGLRLKLRAAESQANGSWVVEGVRTRSGKREETSGEGVAELIAPASQGYTLRVDGRREAESLTLDIPELVAGEQRELDVELRTEDDLHFFGAVVADSDGLPIAGAEVLALLPRPPSKRGTPRRGVRWQSVPLDEGGGFELTTASWKSPQVRVSAPGFLDQEVPLGGGHAEREQARLIRLVATARLEVRVVDAQGWGLPGVQVQVQETMWINGRRYGEYRTGRGTESTTEADGGSTIIDLTPDETLAVDLYRDGVLVLAAVEPLKLERGEVRSLELVLEAGVTLVGILLDQHDEPIANHAVWINPDPGDDARWSARLDSAHGRATTDHEGRFTLEGLQPGPWLVGPGPREWGTPATDDLAARQQTPVEILAAPARQECVLHAYRGLYIRGRVVDASGAPATDTALLGRLTTDRRFDLGHAMTAEDGSFTLGPLLEGDYAITAHKVSEMGGMRSQAEVTARGGDLDVLIRLLATTGVSGTVRGTREGELVAADVTLSPADGSGWNHTQTHSGRFKLSAEKDGLHNLTAYTADGRFGIVRGLRVVSGSILEDVAIEVHPGARLVCRYDGDAEFASVKVMLGEVLIGFDSLRNRFQDKGTVTLTVPAGTLDITFQSLDSPGITRTVVIAAGEEQELEFH